MYKSLSTALAAAVATVFSGACEQVATSPDAVAPLFDATRAPTRTSFDGYMYFCSTFGPDRVWVTPGGTSHIRAFGNINQWVVGNPLIDGTDTVILSGNNFLANGKSTLVPSDTGVNGTWQTNVHIDLRDGTAHGTGRGTGDLRGMSIQFRQVVTPLPSPPAGCDPFGAIVSGIITTPRGP